MANTPYYTKAEADSKNQEVFREIKQTTQAISAGEGGKLYDTLAEAQAYNPKPQDGTIFTVSKITDPTNSGIYSFQSSQANGVRFERDLLTDDDYLQGKVIKNIGAPSSEFKQILSAVKRIDAEGVTKNLYIRRFRGGEPGGIMQIDIYDEDNLYVAAIYSSAYNIPSGEVELKFNTYQYLSSFTMLLDWSEISAMHVYNGAYKLIKVNLDSVNRTYIKDEISKNTVDVSKFLNKKILENKSVTESNFNSVVNSISRIDVKNPKKKLFIKGFTSKVSGERTQINIYDEDDVFVAGFYNGSFIRPTGVSTLDFFITMEGSSVLDSFSMTINWDAMPIINVSASEVFEVIPDYVNRDYIKQELDKASFSRWIGKKWLALGDSITYRDKYQTPVADKCLMKSVTTIAVGGRAIQSFIKDSNGVLLTPAYLQSFDLISIYGAANNTKDVMGSIADDKTANTFYGKVKTCIEYLLENAPNVRIAAIGVHKLGTHSVDFGNTVYYRDFNEELNGYTYQDYNKALGEVCKFYGVPFLDMHEESGMNEFTPQFYSHPVESESGTLDFVHPSDAGYERQVPIISSFFNRL